MVPGGAENTRGPLFRGGLPSGGALAIGSLPAELVEEKPHVLISADGALRGRMA